VLEGTCITKNTNDKSGGTVYVEYHRCDRCGVQYKLYLKSPLGVRDAFQQIAKMLGNKNDEQDICLECQNMVSGTQVVLPLTA
jgi:hypothetical protein